MRYREPNIPYPVNAIQQGDWEEVRKQLIQAASIHGDQFNNFVNGSTNKSAEELIKEWNN